MDQMDLFETVEKQEKEIKIKKRYEKYPDHLNFKVFDIPFYVTKNFYNHMVDYHVIQPQCLYIDIVENLSVEKFKKDCIEVIYFMGESNYPEYPNMVNDLVDIYKYYYENKDQLIDLIEMGSKKFKKYNECIGDLIRLHDPKDKNIKNIKYFRLQV